MFSKSLHIPDIKILRPVKHEDERGFFSEIFNSVELASADIRLEIVQENFSLSTQTDTIRGLHLQTPPHAQAKMVQVVSGAIFDVAVDLRQGSPWYGQSVSAELSAAEWNQILVPAGFAHGFCTLEPDTAVIYRVDAPYSPEHETGIRWNDPSLAIPWPLSGTEPFLSPKDAALPLLADFTSPFVYEESPA
jgi:dTDP-4-dehydrorhamnose 3,5-epimerase